MYTSKLTSNHVIMEKTEVITIRISIPMKEWLIEAAGHPKGISDLIRKILEDAMVPTTVQNLEPKELENLHRPRRPKLDHTKEPFIFRGQRQNYHG